MSVLIWRSSAFDIDKYTHTHMNIQTFTCKFVIDIQYEHTFSVFINKTCLNLITFELYFEDKTFNIKFKLKKKYSF